MWEADDGTVWRMRAPNDPKKIQRDIGRRIAELRIGLDLTQAQFARRLRVRSTHYVARIEAGTQSFRIDTLARVANALDVRVAELFETPALARAGRGRPRKNP